MLDALEMLQGVPLPASLLESEILPARVTNYSAADLDTLFAAGELVWVGVEPLGERDGRVAIYLTDRFADLWPPQSLRSSAETSETEQKLLAVLATGGAQFFDALHQAAGGGYPGQSLDALWSLVWQSKVTNDSFHAVRAYLARPSTSRPSKRSHNQQSFRSRRTMPPSAQGRWSVLQRPSEEPTATEWLHKMAHQMLQRYGVLVREAAAAENMPGGFSAMYGVLKALEESGRIRRGYFVEALGATQFALPAAVDLLRSLRTGPDPNKDETLLMAAQDPAQPYGSILPWPRGNDATNEAPSAPTDESDASSTPIIDVSRTRSLVRSVSAKVILLNGELLAYLRGDGSGVQTFLPEQEPERSHAADALAKFLAARGHEQSRKPGNRRRGGTLIVTIDDAPAMEHFLTGALTKAGFYAGPAGMQLRRMLTPLGAPVAEESEDSEDVEPVENEAAEPVEADA